MHKCPWCSAEAVSNLAVRWSSRSSPATCAGCGKLSHVLASTSKGISTITFVLLCCMVIAGFMTQSYGVGFAGVGVVVYCNSQSWRRAELFPISPESASTAEKVAWWVIALSLLAKMFS
jgi:hypothetical protein